MFRKILRKVFDAPVHDSIARGVDVRNALRAPPKDVTGERKGLIDKTTSGPTPRLEMQIRGARPQTKILSSRPRNAQEGSSSCLRSRASRDQPDPM